MRRLLRPRWLALHLLVLAAVVVMVSLGFWQLRRLDERRERNDLVEARMALPAAPVGELVDEADDVDDLRFRAVTVEGEGYGTSTSVRTTQGGAAGGYLFSTVRLDDGRSVWVLRGFGAVDDEGEVVVDGTGPGEVAVEGIAVPIDRLPRTSRQALESVPADAAGDVLPVAVQATEADPPLVAVPAPTLDEGPHLGYAIQWFLFAAVAVVGYPFLLRRRLRDEDEEGERDELVATAAGDGAR